MEKFMYGEPPRASIQANIVSLVLKVIRYVDAWNDATRNPDNPCVNISVRAVKTVT